MAEATKADLLVQIEELTKRATSAEQRCGQLTTELAAVTENAAKANKAHAELAEQHETVQIELRDTRSSLKAYKGSATRAKGEATVLRKQLSPETRKLGPMKPARNDQEVADRREALDAALAADTTELVFSDGAREIREIAPLTVTGDAWRTSPHHRVLNHEPLLEPGDCQRQEIVLRGVALLNEAGEQVGWCSIEPLKMYRNHRYQLPQNSIRF